MNSYGENIKSYRAENKLKQEELAKQLGISSNMLGKIERGERKPNKEVQEKKQIAEKKEQILSYVKEHFHEMKDLDLGALTRYEERVNTIYEAAMKQYNSIINPLPLQQPNQQQQPQENANPAQN